jgi:hypothetical protein
MDIGGQLADNERKKFWTAEVWPTIQRVCLRQGCDPYRCYEEAAEASTWGKHGISHNWWQLQGAGDAGFVSWYRQIPAKLPGMSHVTVELQAAFSSLTRAVEAWCREKRKKLDDPGCCLECHFEWEEAVAATAFPPQQRQQLVAEHRELMQLHEAGRLTAQRLEAHTKAERPLFVRYAPQAVAALDQQHVALKTNSKEAA